MLYLAPLIVSYFFGSVSFAILVSKCMSLPSPYSYGSGNPGATNVLRTGNRLAAFVTLLGDAMKGALSVIFVPIFLSVVFELDLPREHMAATSLVGVFIGHVFPVFHNFKGGKGVATAGGGLIGLDWIVGLPVVVTWLAVCVLSRYSSLAAICAAIAAPVMIFLRFDFGVPFILVLVMSVLLILNHRGNVVNLLKGVEPKVGSRDRK
jgi:glycerol-3-phosphate acyltransferase PlsY